MHLHELTTDERKRFRRWLDANGAHVMHPASEWEVFRFRDKNGLHIVYRNNRDSLKFTGDSGEALAAFRNQGAQGWRPAKTATKRKQFAPTKKRVVKETIIARDGDVCFFCLDPLGDDVTIEHLVPVSHGGSNSVKGLALAHQACNQKASHMSLVEKIRMREVKLLLPIYWATA